MSDGWGGATVDVGSGDPDKIVSGDPAVGVAVGIAVGVAVGTAGVGDAVTGAEPESVAGVSGPVAVATWLTS